MGDDPAPLTCLPHAQCGEQVCQGRGGVDSCAALKDDVAKINRANVLASAAALQGHLVWQQCMHAVHLRYRQHTAHKFVYVNLKAQQT